MSRTCGPNRYTENKCLDKKGRGKETGGTRLCITGLFLGVDVPDNVVGQTKDFVSCPLGHLGEPFGFGLVLEGVAREVDACRPS